MSRKITFSIGMNTLMRFLLRILSASVSFFLFRVLSPEDYGVVALGLGIVSLLNSFLIAGIEVSYLKGSFKKFEKLSSVFTVYLMITGLVMMILLLATQFLPSLFEVNEKFIFPTQILFLKTILISPLLCFRIAAQKIKKIDILMSADFAAFGIASSFALLLGFSGFGIWSLIMQNLLLDLVAIVYLAFRLKWFPQFEFDFATVWTLLKSGYPTGIDAMSFSIRERVMKILIGAYLGVNILGLYDIAHRLLMQVVSIFHVTSLQAVGAELSRSDQNSDKKETPESLSNIFNSVSFLIGLLLIPMLLTVAMFPLETFQSFTGKNFSGFETFLIFTCLYVGIYTYETILARICAFVTPVRLLWIRSFPILVLYIFLSFMFVRYGLLSATVVLCVVSFLNIVSMLFQLKIFKTPPVINWLAVLLTGIVTFFLIKNTCLVILNFLTSFAIPKWIGLGLTGIFVSIIFWALIYSLKHLRLQISNQ